MKLIQTFQTLYIHYLTRLVLFSLRRARLVIALSIAAALASLTAAYFWLPINAEQEKLVSQESPSMQRELLFSKAFPQHNNTIIAVLEGQDSWRVGQKTEALAKKLSARKDLFHNVFYPQGINFFHQNGLLYLDEEKLGTFIDGLAQAQPALASLAKDPTLRGLWGLLGDGLTEGGKNKSLQHIVRQLNIALADFQAARPVHNVWQQAQPNWNPDGKTRSGALQIIVIQPMLDFSNPITGAKAIKGVRDLAKTLNLEKAGVRLSLTGREALTADELESIIFNIGVAGAISTLAIVLLLGFGIRSARLIMIIMGVLFTGMSWTLGWAVISIGELNFISSAFAVLFLGLCVDFSIHVSLRYREEWRKTKDPQAAMIATAQGAGGAVSLCALATAIGFLSFAPTEFIGVRDLGIIAGGSMMLALLASWSLLPALLTFLPPKDLEQRTASTSNDITKLAAKVYDFVGKHNRPISLSAVAAGLLFLPIALQMKFDYAVIALKDPQSESVLALKRLLDYGLFTDYTATILASDRAQAKVIADELKDEPSLLRVDNHLAFVPQAQTDKLELIEEARFLLGPALNSPPSGATLNGTDFIRATKKLLRTLSQKSKKQGLDDDERQLARHLVAMLQSTPARFESLNLALMGDYPKLLERLKLSLEAQPFTFDDLPAQVKRESETSDGRIKVSLYPKEKLVSSLALSAFVLTLQNKVADRWGGMGGRPVSEYAVGALMVRSFQTALVIAVIAISLLLLLALRSPTKVVLVLVPIALTSIWTLALCVAFGIDFNFVNILLLPLLLGMGVANGIHILARTDKQDNLDDVMTSSTPAAIFLSNATTLASFGSMSVATHWGLQSMGITLTIAMVLMLLSALIILPAILAWWNPKGTNTKT